jgi:opacity protein-like surface antigen
LLIYGTGGLAFGEINNSNAYVNNTGAIYSRGFFRADNSSVVCPAFGNCIAGAASHTSLGWAAGAGAEARLNQNVSFTVEYLHVNLDSPTVHMVNLAPPGFLNGINPGRIAASYNSANYDIVRGAITYRFQ